LIALVIGVVGAQSYLLVVVYSMMLAMVFTGLSVLISLLARRRQIALGMALGVWVFYELVYGMLMLGTTLYLTPAVLKTVLLAGLMGNPVDIVRVLSLLQIGGPHLYGPAGATLVKLTGSAGMATLYGVLGLLVWVVAPIFVSMKIFDRQNL
jgi:Cu-processing system permease protein